MTRRLLALLAAAIFASPALAVPTGDPPQTFVPPAVSQDWAWIGDSFGSNHCYNTPPSAGTTSPVAGVGEIYAVGGVGGCLPEMVTSISAGRIKFVNQGHPDVFFRIEKAFVVTGGTCTPGDTVVFTANAPLGTDGVQAGTVTFRVNADGTISGSATPSSGGEGYSAVEGYTQTGGTTCTVPPTFTNSLGGTFTWATGGDKSTGAVARYSDWAVRHYDGCIVSVGANDISNGLSGASVIASMTQMIALAKPKCTIVVAMTANPRTGSYTAGQETTRAYYNTWLKRQQGIVVVDYDEVWGDATSTLGEVLPNIMCEGLHPCGPAALYAAMAIVNALTPYLPPVPHYVSNQLDTWSASRPANNLLGTQGMMLGSGGTVTAPVTGTAPTGWTVVRYTGTGTCTAVSSTPAATDRLVGGQREQLVISCPSGGTGNDAYRMFNTIPAASLSVGDVVEGYAAIYVSNASNWAGVGGRIFESSTPTQESMCQRVPTPLLAMPSSATLANLPLAKATLPDFGVLGAGSFRFDCYFRQITMQTAGDTLGVQLYFFGAGVPWSMTVSIGDVWVRKVQ